MQEMTKYPYYEEDEIDLYELWLIIKKRKKLIFLVVFFSFLLAIIYCLMVNPIYKSEFIIQGNAISSFQIKKYIDNFAYLLKEQRYQELDSKLNVSHIKDIKKISASIPRNQKDLVIVTIETTKAPLVKEIEKNVLNYINNINEVKDRITLKRKELEQIIANIQEQINNLEGLRKEVYQNKKILSNLGSIQFDPSRINLAIKDLKNELAQRETQLALLKGASLVVEAVVPRKPAKPKKNLIVAVVTISALFFGIFLAFFLEWLEQARKRYQEGKK